MTETISNLGHGDNASFVEPAQLGRILKPCPTSDPGKMPALIEPLHDDRRQHPNNPAERIRHPRNVRILPPSRDFH